MARLTATIRDWIYDDTLKGLNTREQAELIEKLLVEHQTKKRKGSV